MTRPARTLHGIDMTAPDAVGRLLAFHRAQFGDATMMAEESGGDAPDSGGDDGAQGQAESDRAGHDANGQRAAEEEDSRPSAEEREAEEARIREAATRDATEAATKDLTARLAKALGLDQGGDDDAKDPEALTREADALRVERDSARAEVAATRAAARLGANVDRLLDSRAFAGALAKVDPDDAKAVESLIQETLTSQPHLRAAAPQGRSGGEINGGGAKAPAPDNLEAAVAARYANNNR